jgi:RNA polymerase-binding transcription factor DksA
MKLDEQHRLLLAERARIETLREEIWRNDPDLVLSERSGELSGQDQHPADMGTEMFERTKEISILERLDGELIEIERALTRIEAGTYGTCEACGRRIDAERLRARPAARFCIEDQQAAERAVHRDALR